MKSASLGLGPLSPGAERPVRSWPPVLIAWLVGAAVTVVVMSTVVLWGLGSHRRQIDREWCGVAHLGTTAPVAVDACLERRQAERWGPFLIFGRNNHNSD